MKLKNKIFSLMLLATIAVGCTDDFESTNSDPNKLYNIELRNIFPGTVYRTMNTISDLNYYRMWFYSRQMASRAFNSVWSERGDRYLSSFYVDILRDLESLDVKYTATGDKPNALGVVKTWKAFIFYQLTSLFGPICLSDMGMGDDTSKRSFAYDSEEKAYDGILNLLSTAVDLFDPSSSADALDRDPVYSGDVEKWRKLANTLRLEVAMNIQNISIDKAREYAAKSMEHEDWLISSLDEALAPKYGNVIDVDNSRYWKLIYKDQIQTSGKYDNLPSMNEYFAVYLYTYNDPRMQCYFEESNKYSKEAAPYLMPDFLTRSHDCKQFGCNATQQALHLQWMIEGYEVRDSLRVRYNIPYPPTPENPGGRTPFGWLRPKDPSDPNGTLELPDPLSMSDQAYNRCMIKEKYYEKDAPLTLFRWADACFLCAEASMKFGLGSKTAQSYYEAGINASFQENGISNEVAEYLAQPGVAWGTDHEGLYDTRKLMTATIKGKTDGDEGKLKQIYVQRWIADFGDGLSAWRMERRTRALNLPPLFSNGLNSYEEGGDPDYGYPERVYFSNADRINNETAYYEAVEILKKNSPDVNEARWGDNVFICLHFAKPVPDKEATIAGYRAMTYVPFNMDMQQKKYGANYEEFVKNAQQLTGIKDATLALEEAYSFVINSTVCVYKVEK